MYAGRCVRSRAAARSANAASPTSKRLAQAALRRQMLAQRLEGLERQVSEVLPFHERPIVVPVGQHLAHEGRPVVVAAGAHRHAPDELPPSAVASCEVDADPGCEPERAAARVHQDETRPVGSARAPSAGWRSRAPPGESSQSDPATWRRSIGASGWRGTRGRAARSSGGRTATSWWLDPKLPSSWICVRAPVRSPLPGGRKRVFITRSSFSKQTYSFRSLHVKGGGLRRARDGEPHVGAAAVARLPRCDPAVGLRDRLDDREPEPRAAARARRVGAREALERLLEELRREAAALVGDVQLDRSPSPAAPQRARRRRRGAARCRRGCRAPARAGADRLRRRARRGARVRAAGRSPRPATRTGWRPRTAASATSSVSTLERQLPRVGPGDQRAGPRRAGPAGRPPGTTRRTRLAQLLRRRRRGGARARAPSAGARAAFAARARRRRRTRAPAASASSSRSSISFSVSPSRSTSSPCCGTGSRSPGVSAEIAAARRRIESTGRSDEAREEVAGERREQRARPGPAISSTSRRLASVSARFSRVAPTTSTSRAPPRIDRRGEQPRRLVEPRDRWRSREDRGLERAPQLVRR